MSARPLTGPVQRVPLRYFGCCQVAGCPCRRVIEEKSHAALRRLPGNHGSMFAEALVLLDGAGRDWPLHRPAHGSASSAGWAAAMASAGLICPDHGTALIFEPGRFTYNAAKDCTSLCAAATEPSCDCSCGGRNHGVQFVTPSSSAAGPPTSAEASG